MYSFGLAVCCWAQAGRRRRVAARRRVFLRGENILTPQCFAGDLGNKKGRLQSGLQWVHQMFWAALGGVWNLDRQSMNHTDGGGVEAGVASEPLADERRAGPPQGQRLFIVTSQAQLRIG